MGFFSPCSAKPYQASSSAARQNVKTNNIDRKDETRPHFCFAGATNSGYPRGDTCHGSALGPFGFDLHEFIFKVSGWFAEHPLFCYQFYHHCHPILVRDLPFSCVSTFLSSGYVLAYISIRVKPLARFPPATQKPPYGGERLSTFSPEPFRCICLLPQLLQKIAVLCEVQTRCF